MALQPVCQVHFKGLIKNAASQERLFGAVSADGIPVASLICSL